jgi:hypothetical protein
VTPGVPLTLIRTLLNEDNGCAPPAGAQVDIWHADPNGTDSEEAGRERRARRTCAAMKSLTPTTRPRSRRSIRARIPRAVHIHVPIRLFDSSGNAAYDFLAQLFFDDAVTDTVYQVAAYSSRGARNTRDSNDRVHGSDGSSVLLTLAGRCRRRLRRQVHLRALEDRPDGRRAAPHGAGDDLHRYRVDDDLHRYGVDDDLHRYGVDGDLRRQARRRCQAALRQGRRVARGRPRAAREDPE